MGDNVSRPSSSWLGDFISVSGASCAAVIDWTRGQGFGLSRIISLGNQADINETDVLAPIPADPYTIEDTWAGRKLGGYRNIPAADRESVLDTLLHLSQLAIDFPTIAEIEINPMRVLANGQGAIAVDVRARLKQQNNL